MGKKKTKMEKDIDKILKANGVSEYVLAYQKFKKPSQSTIGGERTLEFDANLYFYLLKRITARYKKVQSI